MRKILGLAFLVVGLGMIAWGSALNPWDGRDRVLTYLLRGLMDGALFLQFAGGFLGSFGVIALLHTPTRNRYRGPVE